MTFIQLRNAVIDRLKEHISRPVVPSDQIAGLPDFPYCYYSILTARTSGHAFGLKEVLNTPDGAVVRRSEPVSASMSFTFCSMNREGGEGYIFGDDEALELAEKGHGFFLLDGHCISTAAGDIVVYRVGAVTQRNGFVVEETVRRYGFDVRFSYVRSDEMSTELIENGSLGLTAK